MVIVTQVDDIYVDHGKRVDRHGQLLLEVDFRPWLKSCLMEFKAYALFLILGLLTENGCRLRAVGNVFNWIVFVVGFNLAKKAWKSVPDKRRNVWALLGYTHTMLQYILLVNDCGLRRLTRDKLLDLNLHGNSTELYDYSLHQNNNVNHNLAIFLDLSFVIVVTSSLAVCTFLVVEKVHLESDGHMSTKSIVFVVVFCLYNWLGLPPNGLQIIRYLVRIGAFAVYGSSGPAQKTIWYWGNVTGQPHLDVRGDMQPVL